MEKNLIIDPNYEIIGGKEHHQHILSTDLLTAVTSGNVVDVKRMIEDGECLDQQDEDGNTGLHLSIIGHHYNIAVRLLNSGCRLDLTNNQGLTPLQLANKCENGEVFRLAIQLTMKDRSQKDKMEKKRKLIVDSENNKEDFIDEILNIDSSMLLKSRLEASTNNLHNAKKVVSNLEHNLTTVRQVVDDLETQLVTSKSLVNQLEMEVGKLKSDLERENRKKARRISNSLPTAKTVDMSLLDSCSVCLEVPRPPLKVFQCPEGHIFCEECKDRPEMTNCPECRVSIQDSNIRNRTMENIIKRMLGNNPNLPK